MIGVLILLGAAAGSPAVAQHSSETHSAAPAAAANCTPEHAAMGHCTKPPAPPKSAPELQKSTCTPEHAAMGHCRLPKQPQEAHPAPPQPDCTPEHAALGHCTLPDQQPTADPHAGHDMGTRVMPPTAPPPPEAHSGPEHAADALFGASQMAATREGLRREHGGLPAHRFVIDRAESRVRKGRDGYLIDGQAWYGGDIDKFWVKGEVEGAFRSRPEHAEVQALWSHAIDPWFDLQAGLRYDPSAGPERAHLVLGLQGLAPYWWEVDGAVFLSNKGEVTARAEVEYDLRITQKLILQPRAEVDLAFQDIPELAVGAGLSEAALGARLRYQLSPLVAPYVGIEYERAAGHTAKFRRSKGEDIGGWNLLTGIRFWF